MTLKEYNAICGRLENFCIYARRRAPYGEPDLLEKAATLERDLLAEHNANGDNLALDCVELSGNPVRTELVARYRRRFAVSGQISALADDLKGGAVTCPEPFKGWLILALNGLLRLCSELSGICFDAFNKMEPQGKAVQDYRQIIQNDKRAGEVCEKLRKAGFLDSEYKYIYTGRGKGKNTREEEGEAARQLVAYFYGEVAPIARYWDIKPRVLSTYINKAHNKPQRVQRVKEAIKD